MKATGVVLAGGEGRRLGAFKPLALLGREPLVVRALDALAPLAEETLLLHGPAENRDRLAALAGRARLVPDPAIGPLGALDVAARLAQEDWLLVTPCDIPWRDGATLATLLQAAKGRDGAVLETQGVCDPLVAAYRREAFATRARDSLAAGERSTRRAIVGLDLARVQAPAGFPGDIDTPAALEQARMRWLR